MIANIHSAVLRGIEAIPVEIEAYMHSGIPQIHVVGLADQTVREAKDRIIAAFQNRGYKLPNKKFIVCLNPTDLKKQGSHLDLPIALALMKVSGMIPEYVGRIGALGAINLSGDVLETDQTFSLVESLIASGCERILIPNTCLNVSRFFPDAKLLPVSNLTEVYEMLSNTACSMSCKTDGSGVQENSKHMQQQRESCEPYKLHPHLDYSQVHGQEMAKRAMMIAVAGHHHLLLYGPPGTGKTMLASRIPSIQMPLRDRNVYERLKLLSCAGQKIDVEADVMPAPYRAPHSGISLSAMLGGMQAHMLGEATLAHKGVLFLDEMPEFKRDVLEGLRGPLESGEVHLSKTAYKANVPSEFILVATANPCPCGYNGFSDRCSCNERDIQRYFSKLSGPMLDRFDLKVEVAFKGGDTALEGQESAVAPHRLKEEGLSSKQMFEQICIARACQENRYKSIEKLNGQLGPNEIAQYCQLTERADKWAAQHLKVSSGEDSLRNQFKIIKLARTIADLEASENIDKGHLIEAFYYNRRKLT